jgi:nucleoside-diphosphate-sugar epimerase
MAVLRVFVIGATGAIGKYVVSSLVRAGHRVTGIARSQGKAAQLNRQGATALSVSIFDRADLTDALRGHNVVINLATAIPPTASFMRTSAWQENDRIRKEGSAAIVDSALAAAVPRLIQESVSMLYRDQGDKWIDENSPADDFPMALGNGAAEANEEAFPAAAATG